MGNVSLSAALKKTDVRITWHLPDVTEQIFQNVRYLYLNFTFSSVLKILNVFLVQITFFI